MTSPKFIPTPSRIENSKYLTEILQRLEISATCVIVVFMKIKNI